MWLLLNLLFTLLSAKYTTKGFRKEGVLNVHLVCHTHDDTGWLKTVEQYYDGSNETIQAASVHQILDTVVPALLENPDRKFIYAEQGFFQRWWRNQTPQMRRSVQQLVKNGQLDFVNGGYCMHDEAATHYVDMIDQTTFGHSFLKDQFNHAPTVGWQIDPFGHSATQAALLSAEAGFNSLFIGRIDNQDRAKRILDGTMEFLWMPSPSLGTAASVWTSADFDGNYSPPKGLCFDVYCHDDPIWDDPSMNLYNVPTIVDIFVQAAQAQAVSVQGNDIIFKMGSDFHYSQANTWYSNLDKLVHYVNKDGRVNTFYSTPAIYAQAKLAQNISWSVKTDDIFPYSDGPHAFWTGYFTSRPALKRMIREGSSLLQTSRQLDLFNKGDGSSLLRFVEEQALNQHHDAVAGTEKQHVAFDYARRLAIGVSDGEKITLNGLKALVQNSALRFAVCRTVNESRCSYTNLGDNEALALVVYNPQARTRSSIIQLPVPHAHWMLFDATGEKKVPFQVRATPPSTIPVDLRDPPAPHSIFFEAALPALGHTTYFLVADKNQLKLETQSRTASRLNAKILPPVEVQTPGKLKTTLVEQQKKPITLENAHLSVTFDPVSGLLSKITNKDKKISTSITQEFLWYKSDDGSSPEGFQPSGAYIFRPAYQHADPVSTDPLTISHSSGPVFQEVVQQVNCWLNQTVRLYNNSKYLEFEWTVGSIPIDDMQGKEIVSRFSSDVRSGQTWYTDSNGREMQERVYNHRPTWDLQVTEPIAGNYYPVNAAIFIKDSQKQLTILTDRSQGGTSLAPGQLELMIHRRILQDDGRGVSEPLNETERIDWDSERHGQGLVVRGKHYLLFETPEQSASHWRPLAQEIFSIPTVGLTKIDIGNGTHDAVAAAIKKWRSTNTAQSVGSAGLPVNVNLMTLYATGNNTGILRLAHEFAIDEDVTLSKTVSVDLSKLFKTLSVTKATEMSLTANREKHPKAENTAAVTSHDQTVSNLIQAGSTLRIRENSAYLAVKEKYKRSDAVRAASKGTDNSLLVSLAPMEIKTYQITYNLHH